MSQITEKRHHFVLLPSEPFSSWGCSLLRRSWEGSAGWVSCFLPPAGDSEATLVSPKNNRASRPSPEQITKKENSCSFKTATEWPETKQKYVWLQSFHTSTSKSWTLGLWMRKVKFSSHTGPLVLYRVWKREAKDARFIFNVKNIAYISR